MRPDATELRTKRTWWWAARSAVNRPRPVTNAGSSSRLMARPTHFIPEPAVAAIIGRRSRQKKLVVGKLAAFLAAEELQKVFDGQCRALGAADVEHHMALMQHDSAMAVFERLPHAVR